jgi:hypothetical protein
MAHSTAIGGVYTILVGSVSAPFQLTVQALDFSTLIQLKKQSELHNLACYNPARPGG